MVRREAVRNLDEPRELPAQLLRFAFSLSSQGLADVRGTAQRATGDYARAAPPELRGIRPVALLEIQPCEVAERGGDVGVVGTKRLLGNGEGALEQRLSLGVAALGLIEAC